MGCFNKQWEHREQSHGKQEKKSPTLSSARLKFDLRLRFEASFGCLVEAENRSQCTKTGQGLPGASGKPSFRYNPLQDPLLLLGTQVEMVKLH